jgi:hypothetical protein
VTLEWEDEAVPAMKVTVSAAMRARDVSRPRAEQVAEAEAAEAGPPSGPRANVTAPGAVRDDEWGARASEPETDGRPAARGDREGRAAGTRNGRMPRDSPRRGRAKR